MELRFGHPGKIGLWIIDAAMAYRRVSAELRRSGLLAIHKRGGAESCG
jgi:hypothetical protein